MIQEMIYQDLPKIKEGGQRINWSLTKNLKVNFKYDNIIGVVEILNYNKNTGKITVSYNENIDTISINDFKKCAIGRLLGKRTSNFKIEIGTRFQDNKRDLTITDREYRLDKNGRKWKYYKYTCNKCGWTEGWMTEHSMETGISCSVCCKYPKTVVKGINDIATTHSHLVKYFVNLEDTYTHTYASNEKVLMKCPNCGFEKEMRINDLCKQNFSCKQCSDGISYPNKFMFNILKKLSVKFKTEYSPKWCKYLFKDKNRQGSYDFYIPSMNLIIEMDGGFHKKTNEMNGQTMEESKFIDDEKDRLALENSIEVIRIDCNYHKVENRFEFIKQNILNSKLNILFDLSKINWELCEKYSNLTYVTIIADLWNKGYKSNKQIREELKLSKSAVRIYLDKCQSLHLIADYDAKIESIKSAINCNKLKRKPIICVQTGELFESATDCARKSLSVFGVQMNQSNISAVCRGIRNNVNGYTFKFN